MLRTTTLALLVSLGAVHPARGQVWLPSGGDGSFALAYQGLSSRHHLDSKGDPFDRGQITNLSLVVSGEYGLTEWFTVDGSVALVASKHEGNDRLHGPWDTGIFHGTLQDARLAVRVGLPVRAGFIVTPFIGGIVPTHHYETRGHSAPGRRLKAFQLGTGIGRDLGPVLRKGYAQALYSFSFVERIAGMSINRSNLDVETGYSITPAATVTFGTAIQRTHGGLLSPLSANYAPEERARFDPFHDRVTRANHVLLSVGATLRLKAALAMFGSVVWMPWGQNTHSVKGFVVGTAWSFSPRMTLGGNASPMTGTGPGRLTEPPSP